MPCSPLSNSQFSLPLPVPGSPGYGLLTPQLPTLSLPNNPPLPFNDLIALFNSVALPIPSFTIPPNIEADINKDLMAAIATLLQSFLPFFAAYSFFLPLLELILCLIEIICSMLNPFAVARAVSRLFRVCLPAFIQLFPFFALILMIISLLLLILQLLEYLINRILGIIAMIIRNIETLVLASGRADEDSILAITIKIGDLLCTLQNLFAIFGVIALLFEVIQSILRLTFSIPPCDSSNDTADGCCSPEYCPSFIKNNTSISSSTGFFQYFPEVGTDSGLILPPGFPPIIDIIRPESWQFYDPNLVQDQQFINITNAFDLPAGTTKIFFPNGATYTSTSDPTSAPYTISFRLFYNPTPFGTDGNGSARYIRITNAIVVAPPTTGVSDYNTTLVAPFDGTLNLIGGQVTEDDGTPIINPNNNNQPYSIDEFFHAPVNQYGPIPQPTDGVLYSDITYTFNINAEVLAGYALITMGCIPSVALNRNFINTTIGAQFNVNGLNLSNITLPDMNAAQQCIINSVNALRAKISPETVVQFQTDVIACLTNLQNETTNALTQAINAGTDQYKSTFTLEPTIQFINYGINVVVSLQEGSGATITTNLPASTASTIASELQLITTFGITTPFVYDGYGSFIATITSAKQGNGTAQVLFNGNYLSELYNPTDIDITPTVSIQSVDYTFVQTNLAAGGVLRDAGDVAREGS